MIFFYVEGIPRCMLKQSLMYFSALLLMFVIIDVLILLAHSCNR